MMRGLLGTLAACLFTAGAPAATVAYLLPAPEKAIVFAPFLLADHDGRYAKAGLDVHFRVVPGGMHVGEALARGEGDLGGAVGDTPLQLRAMGVMVKGVALLGHHSFVTLMLRDSLPSGPAVSGGFGVPSLPDTTTYALKAWITANHFDPARTPVVAASIDALIDGLVEKRLIGIVGTVDWGVRAERRGVTVVYRPVDDVYPAMAQAIMASDHTIRTHPEMIRAFVGATLASIRAIEADPAAAADAWRAFVPGSGYSRDEVIRVFTLLRTNVYGPTTRLGRFDRKTMARAAVATQAQGLPTAKAADSYTNRFVGNE